MKKILLLLAIPIIVLGLTAFSDSPYARRLYPVLADPTCTENQIWYNITTHVAKICTNTGAQTIALAGGGSFAPIDATYITQIANATLTNEQALSALATGLVKNTTGTGVLSIAVSGTDYEVPLTFSSPLVRTVNNIACSTCLTSNTVSSVFGRTGIVIAASSDYTFAQLASIPTTFAGYGISDTSANFFAAITNETGSGLVVGNDSPTFTTFIKTPIVAAPTDGTTAIKFTKTDGSTVVGVWDTTNSRLRIGSGTAPTQVLDVTGNAAISGTLTAGSPTFSGNLFITGAQVISLNSGFKITQGSDGVVNFSNNAVNDFGRLQFGGTTSSFPALKRSTTSLQVRLADDSADGNLTTGNLTIGAGTVILKHLSSTATLDFANLAAIGCEDLTITVTGAALGDTVAIGIPNGSVVANGTFTGWVSATNTVTIRFCTVVSGDPASGTFRADVWQH